MKANELMLGDWVNATFLSLDGHPQKYTKLGTIDAINEGMIECEPIPLTEEILKVNGWEVHRGDDKPTHDTFYNHKIDYRHRLEACPTGGYYWQTNGSLICVINYVHELQHALRLCKLDELADNFKLE